MGTTHLRQTSPHGTRLLGAEVKGEVLLVPVELAEVLPRLLVRNSQHAGDRLADSVAVDQTEVSERRVGSLM